MAQTPRASNLAATGIAGWPDGRPDGRGTRPSSLALDRVTVNQALARGARVHSQAQGAAPASVQGARAHTRVEGQRPQSQHQPSPPLSRAERSERGMRVPKPFARFDPPARAVQRGVKPSQVSADEFTVVKVRGLLAVRWPARVSDRQGLTATRTHTHPATTGHPAGRLRPSGRRGRYRRPVHRGAHAPSRALRRRLRTTALTPTGSQVRGEMRGGAGAGRPLSSPFLPASPPPLTGRCRPTQRAGCGQAAELRGAHPAEDGHPAARPAQRHMHSGRRCAPRCVHCLLATRLTGERGCGAAELMDGPGEAADAAPPAGGATGPEGGAAPPKLRQCTAFAFGRAVAEDMLRTLAAPR